MDDVVLDHEVLVDKFRRVGTVGENATYLGCGQNDPVNFLVLEKAPDCLLVDEVQLAMSSSDNILATSPGE
jgi:hypothetical protein